MKEYNVGLVTLEINSIDHQTRKVKCHISQYPSEYLPLDHLQSSNYHFWSV